MINIKRTFFTFNIRFETNALMDESVTRIVNTINTDDAIPFDQLCKAIPLNEMQFKVVGVDYRSDQEEAGFYSGESTKIITQQADIELIAFKVK